MKINFPKILKEIDLGDYAEEMKGQKVQVWVNPSVAFLKELDAQYNEYTQSAGKKMYDEYLTSMSELLSQGEDRFTIDELKDIIHASLETDPAFWLWLQESVVAAITNHRIGLKKVSAQPPPP